MTRKSDKCNVCQSRDCAKVDVLILHGYADAVIRRDFGMGFPVETLSVHRRKHIPWLDPNVEHSEEEVLKFEGERLQWLAECGDDVGKAITVWKTRHDAMVARIREDRQQRELAARLSGQISGPHKAQLAAPELAGGFEISFQEGRAVVAAKE